ncbi:M9 family metallopeptidase [Chitinimonas naiadis]
MAASPNQPFEPLESVVGTANRSDPPPLQSSRANDRAPRPPMMADANCNVSAFASSQGAALISLIKSSTNQCVNQLYSVTGSDARAVFQESQMVSALDEFARLSTRYDGTNRDSIQQIVTFLRAGYYVQYYNKTDVGSYGPAVKAAQQRALSTFFSNKAIWALTRENGEILGEAVIMIDSAGENARFLPVMKQMLTNFGDAQANVSSVLNAYNSVFTVYFRGHYNDDFKALVKADGSYVTVLSDFYRKNLKLRGTSSEFVLANAAHELARFLQYPERKASVQPLLRQMISENKMTGAGSSIWIAAVDGADYYDKSNCNFYGTCNYKETLKAAVLPIAYKCGPTLTIRAQEMNGQQLADSCAVLAKEEKLFHYGTFGNTDPLTSKPVANDNNTSLEVVVFDDYSNYNTYAGPIFGIDTNNGGMFLEGDPSKPGNQARFIAHEASWKRPVFEVWNLQHEYIHYLDARYNLEGDFGKSNKYNTTWWGEGVAEYLSHQNDYNEAVTEARKGTYKLSTIFGNNYSMADYTNRAYRWGYLAVRFMYERQRPSLENLMAASRKGDYASYNSQLAALGTRLDGEFAQWLNSVSNSGEFAGGKPAGQAGGNTAPQLSNLTDIVAQVRQTIPAISFTVSDKETAAGRLTVSAVAADSSLIPAAGLVLSGTDAQRTLRITPAADKTGETSITVTVSDGVLSSQASFKIKLMADGGTTVTPVALVNGNTVTALTANAKGQLTFVLDVPANAGFLTVRLGNGSGDANLYVKQGAMPTSTNFDASSVGGGNVETILIKSPRAGKTYLLIDAKAAVTGLSLYVLAR